MYRLFALQIYFFLLLFALEIENKISFPNRLKRVDLELVSVFRPRT